MDQKVCRSCWTWYQSGHLVCPKCRVRLTAADATASPAAAEPVPPAPAGQPDGSKLEPQAFPRATPSGWPALVAAVGNKLTLAAGAAVLLALFVLLLGARYFSPISATDGSFSVKAPAGWSASSAKLASGEQPLLYLYGPVQDGYQTHFLVTQVPGSYRPISELEAAWPRLVETQGGGENGSPGPFSTTTVDGAPAIDSDSSIKNGRIEFLVVDHNHRTYAVIFTGAASAFADLRSTGFDRIIASWHWN